MFIFTVFRTKVIFTLFSPRAPSRKFFAARITRKSNVHNGRPIGNSIDAIIAHFQYTGGLTLAELQSGKVPV